MKTVHVKIEGLAPLLMHKYPLTPILGFEKMTAEQQAEHSAYRMEDGTLYVPGSDGVWKGLCDAGKYVKGKGRASLSSVVMACVSVTPERLSLGTKEYAVDSRRAVNPTTSGAIVRNRPRLDKWAVEFYLEYDDTLLSERQMREVVDAMGCRIGCLDFRPKFGRFMVTSWVPQK